MEDNDSPFTILSGFYPWTRPSSGSTRPVASSLQILSQTQVSQILRAGGGGCVELNGMSLRLEIKQ